MTNRDLEKLKTIIKEKVDGKWVPKHDAFGHHYSNGSILQDSVTTKLGILNKPHLLKWAIRKGVEFLEFENRWQRLASHDREELLSGAQSAYTDIRDDAGSVGTQAHNGIEKYILEWISTQKRPDDIKKFLIEKADPRAIASARGIEALFKTKEIIPVASEILVGHHKYSAGTLDFLCFWEGKLTLVDFKTSNHIDKISYSMQVAAYKYFFEHMTGIKIPQLKIIHLSKDYDKYDIYKVNNIGQASIAFKALCRVYDWMTDGKEKVAKDIKRLRI